MEKQKNVPALRFLEFTGEWEEKKLIEIGEFKNGINKSKEDFGFGVPFINLMDVFGKSTISNLNLDLVNANEKEVKLYELKKGDVLFIRSSVKKEGVGETSVVFEDLKNTVYSGFLIRFRDNIIKLNLNFKKYCFATKKFRQDLISLSTTSANTNINQDSLNGLEINLPSLPEQTKIANFLTAIDTKIQQLTQKKTLLEEYKKGVMQKLFSQKIRFKDENGKDYPDWEEKRLGEIAMFFSGGTPLTSKKEFFNGEIPFIRSGEIHSESTEQFITELGLKNSSAKMVKEGDILYALYGATSGEVGISKINGAINQAILCIRSINNHFYISSFLSYQKENITKTYLQGGQGNLSAEIIKSLLIPLSSLPEQTKIANFLSTIDTKIENVTKQIEQTQAYKKGLLQQMFI